MVEASYVYILQNAVRNLFRMFLHFKDVDYAG